jgi:hypothetical protein
MSENEHRMRCLEIAASRNEYAACSEIISEARKYYHFVLGWDTVEPIAVNNPEGLVQSLAK